VRRPAPRPLSAALEDLSARLAPASTLARVQELWPPAVGPAIAAAARPTAEHEGVLTILCDGSVWAQELSLMAGDLIARLNERLGASALRELRCRSA